MNRLVQDLEPGTEITCPRDDAEFDVVKTVGVPPSDKQRRVIRTVGGHVHILERDGEVEVQGAVRLS